MNCPVCKKTIRASIIRSIVNGRKKENCTEIVEVNTERENKSSVNISLHDLNSFNKKDDKNALIVKDNN